MTTSPPQVSLQEIREEVADLETPEERIGYLIELGQTLPDLPTEYQTEEYRVLGCQSMVWVVPNLREGSLFFRGTSDAPMVRGLVAILISIYSGRSPREILDFPIESLFDELHLKSFLTPMRSNGLYSMVQRIQAIARAADAASGKVLATSDSHQRSATSRSSQPAISLDRCRDDFPILSQHIGNDRPLIYLDNAASSQRPSSVIDCMANVFRTHYANVHRSGHDLAVDTTVAMEAARESLRQFVHASSTEEIIFTSGTTASINLVARSWGDANLKEGDEILLTEMEHHSNIVPWQQLTARTGAILRWLPVRDDFLLDLEALPNMLGPRTRLVAFSAVSNVLGTINPVREMVAAGHRFGARVLVDAAQAVPHGSLNAADWDADWIVFSGHKMLGPTGIGVLYGKRDLLESMPPFLGGGNMIKSVTKTGFTPADLPHRFEAGTAPIAEAIAMKPAVDYLARVGSDRILAHERTLASRAIEGLRGIPGLKILGPAIESKTGIVSFVVDNVHPDQIGQYLNALGIAIRVGHHCAMPLHQRFGLPASARASFYLYNTENEVDTFIEAVARAVALGK
ncbi:MAG: SufS family cysteine desulfurase [Planctomycetota bacterium]|jgi:cysteine desulfurase/selenocysteine lyase